MDIDSFSLSTNIYLIVKPLFLQNKIWEILQQPSCFIS